MFKLLVRARDWFLRPMLEDLAFLRHKIQQQKLLHFGRVVELDNIIDNLTEEHIECLRCSKLQEQLDRYAQLFGEPYGRGYW